MAKNDSWVSPVEHTTAFERTVVIGDLHGDLDICLQSLADKGLVRYVSSRDHAGVLAEIRAGLASSHVAALEARMLVQDQRTQLIFLGDILDRYHEGYHILQFLSKVRWDRFGIQVEFVLGNHDLHNFHFFVNPYRAFMLYEGGQFPVERRMAYIGDMGLPDSLTSFLDLHRREILALQSQFYREGRLSWDLGYGRFELRYTHDLSGLVLPRAAEAADEAYWSQQLGEAIGGELGAGQWRRALVEGLGALEHPEGQNWWDIHPPSLPREELWCGGYAAELLYFNLITESWEVPTAGDGGGPPRYHHVLPVDWRVISLVWRRHYGGFFRRVKQMYLEGDTLYVHGGLTPRVMIDSLGLGVMYREGEDAFLRVEGERNYGTLNLVARCNRLAGQIMANALNDLSFQQMNGAEVFDLMGSWRGGVYGFPQFGGVFWGDFEYLRLQWENPRVVQLYRKFLGATCIRRVICGHTRFTDYDNVRYLQLEKPTEIGLDYLCVDNSCSRGYRPDHPVLTGIDFGRDGKVRDPGKYALWS